MAKTMQTIVAVILTMLVGIPVAKADHGGEVLKRGGWFEWSREYHPVRNPPEDLAPGTALYAEFGRYYEKDKDGYVYFWIMLSSDIVSVEYQAKGDCALIRTKVLKGIRYLEPLAEGKSISSSAEQPWVSHPTGAVGWMFKRACAIHSLLE